MHTYPHMCPLKHKASAEPGLLLFVVPVLLRFCGDWDFGVHWDFWKWLSINLWQGNAIVLKLWDLRNISSKQTLPYAESTVCLWKSSNSQIHRIICVGRDLRRSLFQPLAQSRVSYEVGQGFFQSGLEKPPRTDTAQPLWTISFNTWLYT